jgi:hypothetical protein
VTVVRDRVSGEYILESGHWPAMPAAHHRFLERAIPRFRADARLAGVAAGGSFISGRLDEHSDLDLVVIAGPGVAAEVLRDGAEIAGTLGPLLAAVVGDHVGERRLLICLYGPPLLHVDLKFYSLEELAHRVEDPTILWDRHGAVRVAMAHGTAAYPPPRFQWIEDRFWVWMHYTATKIERGELFEAIDAIAFVRARVLGPLALAEAGAQPNGVRRIEQDARERVASLQATVPAYERDSCQKALAASVALYADLRERLAPASLARRGEAERAVRDFLRV